MSAPAPLRLRRLRPTDAPAALDMWVAAWQAAYPQIDFAARRAFIAERIAAHARVGAHRMVAVEADAIVGLLLVDAASGYLDQIAVATDRQGTGVAERLIAEARRLSPSGLELHVNQDNERALAFYRKHGFAVAGEDVNPRSGAKVYRMRWAP